MSIAYLNGKFLPSEEVRISPDDRGFLFADGVYEVVRWYEGFFFDMEGHIARLRRSLKEVRIDWPDAGFFSTIARELINNNGLEKITSLVYLEVTRGAAKRMHTFPVPAISPTVYAFARGFRPERELLEKGIATILRPDPRWTRCDIKSVSLLPNILSLQEAKEAGSLECIFSRDGKITECAHSNVFFVLDNVLITHPESSFVLSGISRKNILRMAKEEKIKVEETALPESKIHEVSEAFVTNTSYEIAPVISINNITVGQGEPGPVTKLLRRKFDAAISGLRG